MIKGIIFDLGNTLIVQQVDSDRRLDQMSLRLLPHVKSVLGLLRKRYRFALLTNTTQTDAKHVAAALGSLGIKQYFDAIITSVDEGVEKPDRRMFTAALRALNVTPEEALMVGNDLKHDIEPAISLGMNTAYFTSTPHPGNPGTQFSSFDELPTLVERLSSDPNSHSAALISEGNNALREHRWADASHAFLKVAHLYKDAGAFEKAADFFMQAAVAWERTEDWRGLGYMWVQCASALQNRRAGAVMDVYDRVEASKHYFPTLDAIAWGRFPYFEKLGRAYRNAGYHLEKAGANQSAYLQYRRSGDAFREGEQLDEASRSYYFSLSSFIDRHGESDEEIINALDNINQRLIQGNADKYLKRAQLYYRGLAGKLISKGNFEGADRFFCKEHEMSRKIARTERRYIKWFLYTLWRFSSEYGTSLWRWTLIAISLFMVAFPAIFRFSGSLLWQEPARGPKWLDYVFFSLMTVTTGTDLSFTPSYYAKWIILIESVLGFLMLGSLLTLFAKKALR
jgi:HAD superfamily hydrolase (TIGR01509 family)